MGAKCQLKINNQIFISMLKLKNLISEQNGGPRQIKRLAYDMDGVLSDFEKQFGVYLRNDRLWDAAVRHKKAISNKKLAATGLTKEQFIAKSNEIRQQVINGDGDEIEVLKDLFKSTFNSYSPGWTMVSFGGVDFWAGMEWMPGGQELVKYVEALPTPKCVLTAGAGEKAKIGKMTWLKNHGMGHYANSQDFTIVNAGRMKGEEARPGDLLIDDKPENVELFKAAGGMGILHTDTPSTIAQLKKYYE